MLCMRVPMSACLYVSSVQNITRLSLVVQTVERGKGERTTRRKIFQLIAALTVIHSHVVREKNYANEISSLRLFFSSRSLLLCICGRLGASIHTQKPHRQALIVSYCSLITNAKKKTKKREREKDPHSSSFTLVFILS